MSETHLQSIFDWLSGVQVPVSSSPIAFTASHPNPTVQNQSLPSPPESRKRPREKMANLVRTPKRQRIAGDVVNLDETPKASSNQGAKLNLQTGSPSLSAHTESQSESQASGRSSPLKRLAAIELDSDGVETRLMDLGDPSLPSALAELLNELDMCKHGIGVISSALQEDMSEKAKSLSSYASFWPFMFASPTEREQYGPTPSLDRVVALVQKASMCEYDQQNESGWNMLVHCQILDEAIGGLQMRNQLVGFAPCTTAKIIHEYLPGSLTPKMVDFCMYLEPETDKAARDASERIRQELPCKMINHTEFYSLRRRPITVSIETKTPSGAQPAAAELQLGTWHAAQWNLLEDLVTRAGGTFDDLPFLPAVIVNGHDWGFTATTRAGKKTIFWSEKRFGSTRDPQDVYKIIWGLQRLAKWTSEVYWPWYRKNALGLCNG